MDIGDDAGSFPSVAVGADGGVHVTYFASGSGDLRYATCEAPCTWSREIVDVGAPAGFFHGWNYTSLARGPNGLELSYYDARNGRLRGASCASHCDTGGAWTTFTVSLHGSTETADRMTSLRVDGAGDRPVAWIDRSGGVRYTRY